MKNTSKIAVIGATGKSGKYLVKELLRQNYKLRVLVRNPSKMTLEHEYLEIIKGNVDDVTILRRLLNGCDAVISALGWGNPPSSNTIFSLATRNILQVMHEFNIRRYIVISGLHVNTSMDKKSQRNKTATAWMYENYNEATVNKQKEYEILLESPLDWTLVRLPMIALTDDHSKVGTSLNDCDGEKISASDLALFLTAQLHSSEFIQKAPFVFNY